MRPPLGQRANRKGYSSYLVAKWEDVVSFSRSPAVLPMLVDDIREYSAAVEVEYTAELRDDEDYSSAARVFLKRRHEARALTGIFKVQPLRTHFINIGSGRHVKVLISVQDNM